VSGRQAGKPGPVAGPRGEADAELRQRLSTELRHLRSLTRETADNFALNREGKVESLLALLAELPPAALRREGPAWLALLRELKVKPEKGRLKDLARVHAAVRALTRALVASAEKRRPRRK
jgi:hypothetical protein